MIKKKVFGIFVLVIMITSALVIPVVAVDFTDTFGKMSLTSSTDVESSVYYLPEATHYTVVHFSSMTTAGYYYLGFTQRLGDGTFGGKASQKATLSSLTMDRKYNFELSKNYHKEFIKGSTAVGTISRVTLSNNQ